MQSFQVALAVAVCHLSATAHLSRHDRHRGLIEQKQDTQAFHMLSEHNGRISSSARKSTSEKERNNPLMFAGKDSAKAQSQSKSVGGHSEGGYWLSDSELEKTNSIDCLHAKIRGSTADCTDHTAAATATATATVAPEVAAGTTPPPVCTDIKPDDELNVANYPVWSDPCCYNGGEYFCDPNQVLSTEQQATVQKDLNQFYSIHPVSCPQLMPYRYHAPNDNYDQRTDRSFRLGVALAKGFSADEADPDSLQAFGLVLLNKWGLQEQYDICPHAAILILLTDLRIAFVASASCEFICKDKGGPEVVSAMIAALDQNGPYAALAAGMKEAGKVIKNQDRYYRAERAAAKKHEVEKSVEQQVAEKQANWDVTQQVVFGTVVFSSIICVMFCVVLHMVPALHDKVFGPSGGKKFLL